MSKLRLAAGVSVLVVIVMAGVAVAIADQQERKDSQPARAEYTVATASAAAGSPAVGGSSMVVPLRRGALGTLPDSVTLVLVGGLLLGLAAAVRRTT